MVPYERMFHGHLVCIPEFNNDKGEYSPQQNYSRPLNCEPW